MNLLAVCVRKILGISIFFLSRFCFGQDSAIPEPQVCPAVKHNAHTSIAEPEALAHLRIENPGSSIIVAYTNFPAQARAAFQKAVSIWERILISGTPIKIHAVWETLSENTLAFSSPTRIFKNFENAPYRDVWYSVTLAEALAGNDLNPDEFDIKITLNANASWSYTTNGFIFEDHYDLVTVALHEIAHGLGVSSSMKLVDNNTKGQWGQTGVPYIYDLFIQNYASSKLVDENNPSAQLAEQLESGNLFFQIASNKYQDNLPKLHVPSPYKTGESISHVDEYEYPSGAANSLMTPVISHAEAIHDPGELVVNMLSQMGWPVYNLNQFNVLASEITPEVLVYPNPASETIRIYIPAGLQHEKLAVSLINIWGIPVLLETQDAISRPTFDMHIGHLPSGNYILRLQTDSQLVNKRIMKF